MPTQEEKYARIDERMKERMLRAGYSPTEPTFDKITTHVQWEQKTKEWNEWQDVRDRLQRQDFEEYSNDYVRNDAVKSFYMDRWGNGYLSKEGRKEGVKLILAQKQAEENNDQRTVLILKMKQYVLESHHGWEHQERWRRALAALGEDTGREPMDIYEARDYRNRGWKRWIPVVKAMENSNE